LKYFPNVFLSQRLSIDEFAGPLSVTDRTATNDKANNRQYSSPKPILNPPKLPHRMNQETKHCHHTHNHSGRSLGDEKEKYSCYDAAYPQPPIKRLVSALLSARKASLTTVSHSHKPTLLPI